MKLLLEGVLLLLQESKQMKHYLSKVTVPVTACLSTQSLKEKKGSGRNLQQAPENNTNCK